MALNDSTMTNYVTDKIAFLSLVRDVPYYNSLIDDMCLRLEPNTKFPLQDNLLTLIELVDAIPIEEVYKQFLVFNALDRTVTEMAREISVDLSEYVDPDTIDDLVEYAGVRSFDEFIKYFQSITYRETILFHVTNIYNIYNLLYGYPEQDSESEFAI